MKIAFRLLLSMAAMLMWVACDEDKPELSDVAVLITPPKTDTITLGSNEKARYTIELYTTHERVSRLLVTSFDAVRGKVEVVDTTFSGKQDIYYLDYTAPTVSRDSLNVTLTFEAWDNLNNHCQTTRVLKVRNNAFLMEEKSGIVLRSAQSGWPDALSFDNPSQTFSWKNSPDSTRADIYLVANDDFTQLSLCSNTKAKMVRINSFDYPAATILSVSAVYESSLRSDRIDDLNVNDVILVGHELQAAGVILITNIVRTGHDNEKCVQLSFKGIGS